MERRLGTPSAARAGLLASVAAFAIAGAAHAGVTAEKVERTAPDKVVVSWSDANPVDVYRLDRPDDGLSKATLLAKAAVRGRLESPTGVSARPYFLLKDAHDGSVVHVAERVLPLAQGSNFRDVGGYPAGGGKHVRWGRIFRSGATPMLTDADVAMVQALGLTQLVDLRSSEERVLAPTRLDGIPYAAVGYSMVQVTGGSSGAMGDDRIHAAYRAFPALLAPQMKILFQSLLRSRGAVAYNCSAGQDRTGFATAIVLLTLGVPREAVLRDYHLSTTYRRPEFEMPRIDAATAAGNPAGALFASYQQAPGGQKAQPLYDAEQRPLLEFALAEVDRRWGSVEGYLDKALGVGPADIARLRAAYLD